MSATTTRTPTAPEQPAKQKPGGTLYRGREGMWSWVLHRITGVAIFFFLLVHILDTALVRVSPEAYNAVIGTYQTPILVQWRPARQPERRLDIAVTRFL